MLFSLTCYQNRYIAFRILSLHFKSDFITPKSSERLAALKEEVGVE